MTFSLLTVSRSDSLAILLPLSLQHHSIHQPRYTLQDHQRQRWLAPHFVRGPLASQHLLQNITPILLSRFCINHSRLRLNVSAFCLVSIVLTCIYTDLISYISHLSLSIIGYRIVVWNYVQVVPTVSLAQPPITKFID